MPTALSMGCGSGSAGLEKKTIVPTGRDRAKVIDARGLSLPDLNPTELCWFKLKNLLKTFGARTAATRGSMIQVAAHFITCADCKSWFRHCGHTPPQPT